MAITCLLLVVAYLYMYTTGQLHQLQPPAFSNKQNQHQRSALSGQHLRQQPPAFAKSDITVSSELREVLTSTINVHDAPTVISAGGNIYKCYILLNEELSTPTVNASNSSSTKQLKLKKSVPALLWHHAFKSPPMKKIVESKWLDNLISFVQAARPNTPITLVASTSNHLSLLLNWLILAQLRLEHPLQNVLVIFLESSPYKLLQEKHIPSLYIPLSDLYKIDGKHIKGARPGRMGLAQVDIVRTTVMRIINHWGYDVANFDTDALILKNPQPLYERYHKSHLIGTAADIPLILHSRWGFTVCMGAVMMRAAKQTGKYCSFSLVIAIIYAGHCGASVSDPYSMRICWREPAIGTVLYLHLGQKPEHRLCMYGRQS